MRREVPGIRGEVKASERRMDVQAESGTSDQETAPGLSRRVFPACKRPVRCPWDQDDRADRIAGRPGRAQAAAIRLLKKRPSRDGIKLQLLYETASAPFGADRQRIGRYGEPQITPPNRALRSDARNPRECRRPGFLQESPVRGNRRWRAVLNITDSDSYGLSTYRSERHFDRLTRDANRYLRRHNGLA